MNMHMGELIPNLVLTIDKEGTPALIPTREKFKLRSKCIKSTLFYYGMQYSSPRQPAPCEGCANKRKSR